uniref:5-hydroxytryptamine receptor 3C n=1 Tax=Cacopsylla melanoneura TaxID=428564 RepID=A0A8D8M842_9HEMI
MCIRLIILVCFITSSVHFKKVRGQQDYCKAKKNTTNPVQELKKCLFKGYNPKAVPLLGQQKKVDVDVSFLLEDVYFFDVSAEATLFVVMDMNWTDPFLTWNPRDYGNVSRIILTQGEPAKIWTPMFTTSYTYRFGGRKDTDNLFRVAKLEISSDGKVMFSDLINVNSICYGELNLFPFDKYDCNSILMSDNFENEVVFRFWENGKYSNYSQLNMTVFTKKHLEVESNSVALDVNKASSPIDEQNMTITILYISLNIARKTGTHVLVFHVPAVGFCLLLVLPLWISANSMSRFLYPLIVMFGSLFQIDALSNLMKLPSVHYNQPINIVSFYHAMMMLSLLVLVESMLSSALWRRRPLPPWLRGPYDTIYKLPGIQGLIEFTLFEKTHPEAFQGQKQEEYPGESGDSAASTLKCLAKLIDRIFFCCLGIVAVFLYFDLVPRS